jgi:hypothetical protein
MLFSAASSCFEFSEADDWLALLDAIEGLALAAATGLSGTNEGISAVAGVWAVVDCEPDCMIERPPGRIEPENAAFSDCCSVWYLEMFTDEIENSTMNSAISSVIMSA